MTTGPNPFMKYIAPGADWRSGLNMIDIGVNLSSAQFDRDRKQVLARAMAAGVSRIILTGTTLEGSLKSERFIALAPERLSFTAGVHPHYASAWNDDALVTFRRLWAHPACAAVGECGLDYFRDLSPRAVQRKVLEAHVSWALALDKPLFLHCRDAFDDFFAIMRDFVAAGGRGVVHCFTGTRTEMEAFVAHGLHIGVTGWVTDLRRGKALREAVPHIPAHMLHLETDAPFLAPASVTKEKGRARNEPAYLPLVAEAVAALRNVPLEQVAQQCADNSAALFGLDAAKRHATCAPAKP